jgi:two-component system response regulator YesN
MHSPFAPTETRRVLIVDDDPAVLEGLRTGFEMEGKPVVTSGAFHDARRRLLEEDFDVLATDVRLGAFNGLQLAVIARDRNPEMKIIVFSGFDDAVLQAEAARLRARYLVKPVSLERLFEVIASL